MARFDVYQGKNSEVVYLLDCQADMLDVFGTRFVVPLHRASGARAADRLHPIFEVEDERVVMVTHLALAVPLNALGARVTNLADEQPRIMGALDMLITGY